MVGIRQKLSESRKTGMVLGVLLVIGGTIAVAYHRDFGSSASHAGVLLP